MANPITIEIIRNAFISAAEEMNASLARSAYSPIIYEMKDCSVGIFNKETALLGQSAGLPIFLGNLDHCIKLTTESIGGQRKYKSGDLYILNDSYLTGTHLNDITTISPIFHDGELVGFSATRAHWIDVGAKDPGYPMDATEIYQEGIRIPPLKLYDGGTPRQDVIQMLTINSRFKEAALGDLGAQIAACRTGEKRLQEIIRRFGLKTVNEAIDDIFAQSAVMDRDVITRIPDGGYEAEGCLDNDGHGDDPVNVKVKVYIQGENMTIDLTGSSPQQQGQTNCGLAQTISACRVAFKELVNPHTPVTGGNFRNLEVITPEGTIFNATEPAACGWYFSALGLLIDLVVKALSPTIKDLSAAAHYGDSMVITFAGTEPNRHTPFLSVEATAGGWGGFAKADGQNALINNVNGDFKNMPIEVFETKYPVKVTTYALRQDSGGAGAHRGGTGVVRGYQLRTDRSWLYLWFERYKTPAWGLFGGKDGAKPKVTVCIPNGETVDMLKVNARPLTRDTVVIAYTGGGGGFGHPFDRDPHHVLEDVLHGYVSLEAAKSDYGVIIREGTFEVDEEETLKCRTSSHNDCVL